MGMCARCARYNVVYGHSWGVTALGIDKGHKTRLRDLLGHHDVEQRLVDENSPRG